MVDLGRATMGTAQTDNRMSLLDFKLPGMDTPEGQGLLSAAFSLLQARKMPGERGIGGALGAAGQQYMGTRSQAQEQMQRKKMQDLQMQQHQEALLAQQSAQQQRATDEQAVRGSIDNFDPRQFLRNNPSASLGALDQGMRLHGALNPSPKFETVAPGSSMYRMGANGPELAMTAPKPIEPKSLPSAVQEYEYAKGQGYKGTFEQWDTARKRAGATSVNVNADNLGLKPKDRFDMEQKLSADYQKATVTDRAIVSTAQDVENILKQGGALKDQAAIYKFAKALDPEGAVREADYAAIVRTAGGLDYVQNLFNRALTGEQLSPKQRGEMSSLMNSMAGVAKQRITKQQKTFGGNAKMYNLEPSNVFQASEVPANDGWGIKRVPEWLSTASTRLTGRCSR